MSWHVIKIKLALLNSFYLPADGKELLSSMFVKLGLSSRDLTSGSKSKKAPSAKAKASNPYGTIRVKGKGKKGKKSKETKDMQMAAAGKSKSMIILVPPEEKPERPRTNTVIEKAETPKAEKKRRRKDTKTKKKKRKGTKGTADSIPTLALQNGSRPKGKKPTPKRDKNEDVAAESFYVSDNFGLEVKKQILCYLDANNLCTWLRFNKSVSQLRYCMYLLFVLKVESRCTGNRIIHIDMFYLVY